MIRSFGPESEENKKYILLLIADDDSGGKEMKNNRAKLRFSHLYIFIPCVNYSIHFGK